MNKIILGRGEGKTAQLLKEASQFKGYNLIVCMERREVLRVWRMILEKKYDLPQPITFDEFLNKKYHGHNVDRIFIDNADMLLQYITQGSPLIHTITMLKEDEMKE